jgi:hypothetical protein
MAQYGFRLFKWTIYGLLERNVWFFLRTEKTLTAFIDSATCVVCQTCGRRGVNGSSIKRQLYRKPWEARSFLHPEDCL